MMSLPGRLKTYRTFQQIGSLFAVATRAAVLPDQLQACNPDVVPASQAEA